ncbi:pilus assembly FimT family protein [Desulfovulcanus sp.]
MNKDKCNKIIKIGKGNSGFTLIEIIAVFIILAILAAVAVSRTVLNDDSISKIDIVKSHLRYAQVRAMNMNQVRGIKSDGNKYWLFRNGNSNDKALLPGEDNIDVSIKMDKFTLSFDKKGIPCSDEAGTMPLTSNLHIKVEGRDDAIIVYCKTGYIP